MGEVHKIEKERKDGEDALQVAEQWLGLKNFFFF